jgi:Uma2 family endonuclease
MAAAASTAATPPASEPDDRRFVLHGVTWAQYLAVRAMFDDRPGLRMNFVEGTLELMSPSKEHEYIKKQLARLLELYALARGVRLHGYGQTTFRHEAAERGLEPDECYWVGDVDGEYPHLAIEVVVTSGGIDKLKAYAPLGVREVWFWRSDRFELYGLRDGAYSPIARSALLPLLDVEELARHVRMRDQADAARAWWEALGGR